MPEPVTPSPVIPRDPAELRDLSSGVTAITTLATNLSVFLYSFLLFVFCGYWTPFRDMCFLACHNPNSVRSDSTTKHIIITVR